VLTRAETKSLVEAEAQMALLPLVHAKGYRTTAGDLVAAMDAYRLRAMGRIPGLSQCTEEDVSLLAAHALADYAKRQESLRPACLEMAGLPDEANILRTSRLVGGGNG